MPMTPSTAMAGAKASAAWGKSGIAYRMNPNVPIFSITPARMIDPAAGASVWASGSQVCSRSEEHTSELQSQSNLVCRLLLEKKKKKKQNYRNHRNDMSKSQKTP